MDIDEEYHPVECHKIDIETYKPLHITTSTDDGLTCVILWNEFSILLYDSNKLSDPPTLYHHDSSILNVQSVRNVLLINDGENLIHFTLLRQHGCLQKRIRFKRIFEDIYKLQIDDGRIAMLRLKQNEQWIYTFNLIDSSKFKLHTKYKITNETLNLSKAQLYIRPLKCFTVDFIRCILHLNTNTADLDTLMLFVVINDVVYNRLLDTIDINLNKLYTCPATVRRIDFDVKDSSTLYLFLSTGSAILLSAELGSIRSETIHLNCTLRRVTLSNESIVYTDTEKLWSSSRKGQTNVEHRLLKFRNVYDFAFDVQTNYIYCITGNNLLYRFNLSHDDASKCNGADDDGFIPIPKSLKETDKIFECILDEMKQNERIVNAIVDENHLITTIAISERPDLSLHNLLTSVRIYDVNDIDMDDEDLTFVTDLHNYYRQNTDVYLIEFTMSDDFQAKFKEFLKSASQIWYLNVNVKDDVEQCNVCIKLTDCRNFKIVVPTFRRIAIPSVVSLKLITLIANVIDPHIQNWYTFPSKSALVDLKYHIEVNARRNLLKRKSTKLIVSNEDDRIVDVALKHSGLICNVENNQTVSPSTNFAHYVRIPEPYSVYAQKFTERFVEFVNPKFARNVADKLHNGLDRLRDFHITVQNVVVDVDVASDGKMKRVKVNSNDSEVSWGMYLFVSECLRRFADVDKHRSMPHFDFMKLQNIKQDVNTILTSDSYSTNDIQDALIRLSEEFSHIIGLLPL